MKAKQSRRVRGRKCILHKRAKQTKYDDGINKPKEKAELIRAEDYTKIQKKLRRGIERGRRMRTAG
jgi:hypothetical protein